MEESEFDSLADEATENWGVVAEAIQDFDENIPEYKGLLRCKQQARNYYPPLD